MSRFTNARFRCGWVLFIEVIVCFLCYISYYVGVLWEESSSANDSNFNGLAPLIVFSVVFYLLSLSAAALHGKLHSKKYLAISTAFWVLAMLSQLVEYIPVFSLRRILFLVFPWGIFVPITGMPLLFPIEPVLTVLIFALIHHLLYLIFSLQRKKEGKK